MKAPTLTELHATVTLLAKTQGKLVAEVESLKAERAILRSELRAAAKIIARQETLDVARGADQPSTDEAHIVGLAVAEASERTGISAHFIMSGDRRHAVCRARWMVMGIARDAGLSTAAIGRALAMDHTSVMYGLRRLEGK